MKILVLATDYPDEKGSINSTFIHVRCMYYLSHGIDVTVVNFDTESDYRLDGIPVLSIDSFESRYGNELNQFDVLCLHAVNLRNHYRFLKRHMEQLDKIVLFFHGHEIMYVNQQYPKPYDFQPRGSLKNRIMRNVYDRFKIRVWKRFILTSKKQLNLVFVSDWMKQVFLENTGLQEGQLPHPTYVIYNSIGQSWEHESYPREAAKAYDFITIRSFLDQSKYAIDIVNQWALNNPDLSFLVIGKGEYFKHNQKAPNLRLVEGTFGHDKLKTYADQARCALMPTRADAQGLMACELVSYGMPLITSEIDVCRRVFGTYPNVAFIPNDSDGRVLRGMLEQLEANYRNTTDKRFFAENTVEREVQLFRDICHEAS